MLGDKVPAQVAPGNPLQGWEVLLEQGLSLPSSEPLGPVLSEVQEPLAVVVIPSKPFCSILGTAKPQQQLLLITPQAVAWSVKIPSIKGAICSEMFTL